MKMLNLKLGSRLVLLQHRLQVSYYCISRTGYIYYQQCRVYSQLVEQLPKAFSLESANTTKAVTLQIQRILKRFPSDIRPISKMDEIPFTPEVVLLLIFFKYN